MEGIDLSTFKKGQYYTRKEINLVLGGGVQDFLPHKDGKVLCVCVTPDLNPHLPETILVGKGEQITRWGKVFAAQIEFIPLFVKRSTSTWEYIENYKVASLSEDPSEIARHERFSGRDDIVMVLNLEKEKR